MLFPFRAYIIVAPICLFVWKFATDGHHTKGALAEAAAPVLFGFMICDLAFILAAVILYFTHRRELVAENLLFAGVTFLIAVMIAPMAAVS